MQLHVVVPTRAEENKHFAFTCGQSRSHYCRDNVRSIPLKFSQTLSALTVALLYTLRLRLRVFENRVLRKVYGPKRVEVTGEWRRLHNEELNDLYSLPNIVRVVKSRRMRWAGHVARMGENRGVHRVLMGKPEGKRPLGRPRRRWEDNIKMDLQEVGGGRGD